MARLGEVIRESWAGWTDEPLEATVFATADADAIAQLLAAFAREHLGAAIEDALGYHASVGCTALVRLDDGRDVAIKVHQPRTSATFLASVVAVQRHVYEQGLPVPQPLVGPVPIGTTLATAESALPDPGPARDDVDRLRAASAAGLAALIDAARPLALDPLAAGLDEHPMIEPEGSLWGRPHSPLFDFARPAPHADEIDELGRAGRRARDADPSPIVLAHGDWTVRNLRFDAGELVAIYDWDSLIRFREARAVGQAAQTWNATGEPGSPARPDVAEVAAYVKEYERARGQAFTPAERRSIGGAALFTLAYAARCESALLARWPEHAHAHQALDRLLADGDRLLTL